MIVRITSKLGKKIGESPRQTFPLDPNPFVDWTAHLFTADRTQYILVTNTASLYSTVIYGRGITNDSAFLECLTSAIGQFLRDDGNGFFYERFVVSSMGTIYFAKTLDRVVTGSMNDLVKQARFHLTTEEISPYDLSFVLNDVPMLAYLGGKSPAMAFKALSITREVPQQENGADNVT